MVSPGDTAQDLDERAEQFLRAGTRVIWVIYPKTRRFHVYQPRGGSQVLEIDDILQAPELFGDWSIPVARLFEIGV